MPRLSQYSLPLTAAVVAIPALLIAGVQASAQDARDPAADEARAYFEANVRPVLVEHCVECHSGDKPKGGLALNSTEGIAGGVAGEPIYVAGDVEASLIVEAVRYDDLFIAMPPTGKIPDKDIAAIERWIELGGDLPARLEIGAEEGVRWCFQPPLDVEAPVAAPGTASDAIDRFLGAALQEAGVEPSDPADRRSWLRRVTYDLTGLPPTVLELQAFEADGAPGAHERVVDRLLAAPAFGERWARRWLDLVRYAETKAHEFDYPILNAYRYRDYVIRAFEADVPYDQFVTEFLAGDLLDSPRLDPTGTWSESLLGTGAWQLGEEVHSPVEPRGDQSDRLAHQIEVFSKSVLALGVACARCHDHKFDPISAEDYHSLVGFALSTAPRQVRYESDATNRAVAGELDAFNERHDLEIRRAVANAVRRSAAGLEHAGTHIRAARKSEPRAPSLMNVGGIDALALLSQRARVDLLLEDFEAESFPGGLLGGWAAEGEAFLDRPIRRADIQPSQSDLAPRGLGCVNSYAGHPEATDFSADRYVGTLTSEPFHVTRRYLHFLVNGGDMATVRVELIANATGEVLRTAHGRRSNVYAPTRWDLEGLGGTRVRIRLVDDESGGWGQIGADHFVLSDGPDAQVLGQALPVGVWAELLEGYGKGLDRPVFAHRVDSWSADSGVDPSRIGTFFEWAQLLIADGEDAPAWLRWLTDAPVPEDAVPSREPRTLVDYGSLSGSRWITNGPAFGAGPRGPGELALGRGKDGQLRLDSIRAMAAAFADPGWRDLFLEESETGRGGSLNWVQAGRTLVSPSFTTETGDIAHLVRGKGNLLASIASHKMVAGPLHGRSILRFDTGGEWQWVHQSMPSAAGLDVRIELTSSGNGGLEIARTVELEKGARMGPAIDISWVQDRYEEALAEHKHDAGPKLLGLLLRDAAELVELGGVAGKSLTDGERATLYAIAEFVATRLPSASASIGAELAGIADEHASILGRRVLGSRLAPALLELEGRDERVLDRGSWRAPGDRAPRRSLSILRTDDAPLARDGEGSGRLALARDLLGSPSGIVQRVWVNRTWHALFGKGLVETTDDFGAMGTKPTHPALLDRLARDFAADGWSTKRLIRRLVLTDAYRRSTRPRSSARELDPTGALLGHMRVRRLEAEEVRDSLLAMSGRLDPERFGAPVPLHLTPFMTGRGRPGTSGPLDGGGRRSIYLAVRRNFPHPLLTVFDQPTPSTCHGRRTSANVPAQALALWNDPFVEEQAALLAADLPGDAGQAIEQLWLRVLARRPRPDEFQVATKFTARAESLEVGLVDLVHVLFNAKETLFVE